MDVPSSTRDRFSAFTVAVRVALLLAWMATIFAFSEQSGSESEVSSDALAYFARALGIPLPIDVLTFLIRKAAHSFAYFGLAVLSFRVAVLTRLSLMNAAFCSLAFVLTYAVSDELHQLVVPGRSGELRDVVIDTTAGALGVLVSYFVYRSAKHHCNRHKKAADNGSKPLPAA